MRLNALILLTCLVPLSVALCGCTSAGAPRSTRTNYHNWVKVSGVVTYRERIALPSDAVVTARLLDVSKPNAPGVPICEQVISNPGQVPVPFVLTVDPKTIDQNRNYAIEATISIGRQVRWRSTQQYGVITRGNPLNGVMVFVQQTD